MAITFDEQGHVVWTPRELYQLAEDDSRRLVNRYLMTGTPCAFAEYTGYCSFLEAVAERTGIHPRNLYLRGSCQIGFSIAPRAKVWTVMCDGSDLDLVIVDMEYFHRCDQEVRRWEERNTARFLQGRASRAFFRRQQDRQFNCFRDEDLPPVVCVHHQDTMSRIAALELCGRHRGLSAFIYPDWHSAQRRYEYDLRLLREGIAAGSLTPPSDAPLPAETSEQSAAPAQPPAGQDVASQ